MKNFLNKYVFEVFTAVIMLSLLTGVTFITSRFDEQVRIFKHKCEEAGGVAYTPNATRGRIDPICMKPDAIILIDF